MGASVRFTAFLYGDQSVQFLSFDEVDLKDGADLVISGCSVVPCGGGVGSEDFPVLPGVCRVGGTLFLVGGLDEVEDPSIGTTLLPSNGLWSVPPPPPRRGNSTYSSSPGSSPIPGGSFLRTWTRCNATMEQGRTTPMVVPLNDGRIFICGGIALPECWVEIYDPEKGEFDRRDAPGDIWNHQPASCFLWAADDASSKHDHRKPLVMLYYHAGPRRLEGGQPPGQLSSWLDAEEERHPSLLLYDVERNSWETFADNLPAPEPPGLFQWEKRNLIYVGDNILFIIDHASRWFVYDLSAKKEVGKVDVMVKDQVVIEAFHLRSFRNNDSGSTSSIFFIFMPDVDDIYTANLDLRYAKVEVVQRKGEDYIAKVHSSGILRVGYFTDLYIFADEASRKRAAEEDLLKEKERRMRSE